MNPIKSAEVPSTVWSTIEKGFSVERYFGEALIVIFILVIAGIIVYYINHRLDYGIKLQLMGDA